VSEVQTEPLSLASVNASLNEVGNTVRNNYETKTETEERGGGGGGGEGIGITGPSWDLIIALRDSHSLCYIDCSTLKSRTVSLNEHVWDTHVSFTPLNLSLSSDRKYLLVGS